MIEPARFTPESLRAPKAGGLDVRTTLRHFAIVTYTVECAALERHLSERFEPERIQTSGGERALISVVPFFDVDFRFVRMPWPQFSFGQTNYRAHVIDRETRERCVWFFGTCLGSPLIIVPRHLWRLPWHHGRFRFDCDWSRPEGRYCRYQLQTTSDWAPARLDLQDTGTPVTSLAGFPDLETGLVVLTHPLVGYYRRRDTQVGTYRVWHERIEASVANVRDARFPLLERLDLVSPEQQLVPHSVLLQHEIEFTIDLPPRVA